MAGGGGSSARSLPGGGFPGRGTVSLQQWKESQDMPSACSPGGG